MESSQPEPLQAADAYNLLNRLWYLCVEILWTHIRVYGAVNTSFVT